MARKVKKHFRKFVYLFLLLIMAWIARYAWISFPVISGFVAKNACSCAFLQGRQKAEIVKEVESFPLNMAAFRINLRDSSVTASVMGLAVKKAIFRRGAGCVLVNDLSEEEIRKQPFIFQSAPSFPDTAMQLAQPDGEPGYQIDSILLKHAVHESILRRHEMTRAVVVLFNGRIVTEEYADGFHRATPFLGWSMAKSIISALAGILVQRGDLVVNSPAPIPAWSGDKKGKITIEQLLWQTSGLDFEEDYSKSSDVTRMLFREGDMAAYAASRPLKYEPGTVFNYCGGNSNLLSWIIRRTAGENYHLFPYEALFSRIGMHSTLLETDASGTFVGSSYVYATARDYARFGWLYANDGFWNGVRILPEGWVTRTITPPAANPQKDYGYHFWLNGIDRASGSRKYAGMPENMFYAGGYGGQRIYIFPSHKLVIVRLGLKSFDEQLFLSRVFEAITPVTDTE